MAQRATAGLVNLIGRRASCSGGQRAGDPRLQQLQRMDPHRNGDVGTIVDRRQKGQNSDVALDEDINASCMKNLLWAHPELLSFVLDSPPQDAR